MATRRRLPVNETKARFWRGHLADQAAGWLTIRDYCAEHGLSEPSFYAWRREIARRDRIATRGTTRGRSAQTVGKPDFVRLEVRSSVDATPSPIELVLPGNLRVVVPAGTTRDQLCVVLAALQATAAAGAQPC